MLQNNNKLFTCLTLLLCLATLLTAATVGPATGQTAANPHIMQTTHSHHHAHRQRHHASATKPVSQRQPRRLQHNAKADAELLPGVTMPPLPLARHNATDTTRLRRVQPHNRYNQVLTRRLHQARPNEWDYNTYNIYTNTFGPPAPPSKQAGKGEDNTQDVEFIGVGSAGRGYVAATAAPPNLNRRVGAGMGTVPPLVPARRGYATSAGSGAGAATSTTTTAPHTSFTTEDAFETNSISRNYPSDAKEMERRHICVQQRTVTMPVKTTEVYMRPTWKHISTPCQPPTYMGQMCTRVQLVHEQAYRDVIKQKEAQQVTYDCCTGWSRETARADACMKPICSMRCQNGGNCTAPQSCNCPVGFAGRFCEQDINECHLDKPCDQQCVNTQGSYFCRCRPGFVLQADQQSCKKVAAHADDAFEARDLENDIDDGDAEMATRIQKIERSLANERVHTNELQKSLQATYSVVDTLKSRLNTLEKQQTDVSRLQTNLYKTESRTNKLEGMLNMLLKCRNGPNADCP